MTDIPTSLNQHLGQELGESQANIVVNSDQKAVHYKEPHSRLVVRPHDLQIHQRKLVCNRNILHSVSLTLSIYPTLMLCILNHVVFIQWLLKYMLGVTKPYRVGRVEPIGQIQKRLPISPCTNATNPLNCHGCQYQPVWTGGKRAGGHVTVHVNKSATVYSSFTILLHR